VCARVSTCCTGCVYEQADKAKNNMDSANAYAVMNILSVVMHTHIPTSCIITCTRLHYSMLVRYWEHDLGIHSNIHANKQICEQTYMQTNFHACKHIHTHADASTFLMLPCHETSGPSSDTRAHTHTHTHTHTLTHTHRRCGPSLWWHRRSS